ncbi:BrnT family toxin [Rhizobium sp. TRM96647]|uniref:BrnT family toxin n=1 Tax=unclassified Rhizobium TaxID=2613769 RepID=UPI0021E6F069|nr:MULTISPECIES: BrnT family toxin [unclassified Rhizobium]MCV3735870.1 BrnT family toxin [Rhizobium sp. TRM96647]MCV3758468.1 BrnT family toxin [Rhizobium sp. TRM96650]
MQIVYDERKRRSNIEKHGYDFADLTPDFFVRSTIVPVQRGRLMAIGVLHRGVIAVVFVTLGSQGLSIISMRPASRKERSAHGYA